MPQCGQRILGFTGVMFIYFTFDSAGSPAWIEIIRPLRCQHVGQWFAGSFSNPRGQGFGG